MNTSDSMDTSPLFAAVLVISVLGPLTAAAYIYGGAPVLAAVGASSVAALLGWWRSSHRPQPTRPRAFSAYIASMVVLMALYAEQWSGHFTRTLASMFPRVFPAGVGISDHAFVAVFPLAGSAAMSLGALAYARGTPIGRFAAWFTFSWSAVWAIEVYALPLLAAEPAGVLPGAWTAPLPLAVALYGIYRLLGADEPRLASAATSDRVPRSERVAR
jgi:hypothetical protein